MQKEREKQDIKFYLCEFDKKKKKKSLTFASFPKKII
jgi:hypothetical protein